MPTQSEVARHLDLGGVRYIRELRDEGTIPNAKTSTLDEIRVAYIRHLRECAAGRGGVSAQRNLTEERAKREAVQRRREELELGQLEGQLLDRDDVIRTWATQISVAKTKLRGLVKTGLLHIPKFNQKQARVLQKLIDECLADLAGDGLPTDRKRVRRRVARRR